jgi:hypothetical protein
MSNKLMGETHAKPEACPKCKSPRVGGPYFKEHGVDVYRCCACGEQFPWRAPVEIAPVPVRIPAPWSNPPCPKCGALSQGPFGSQGREFRCSRCGHQHGADPVAPRR